VTTAGENIAYGTTGAKDILLQLIIDDGVASRGHRTNIFKPEFKVLGSSSSVHVTYKHETVINYAGGMTSNNKHGIIQSIDCTPASSSSSSDKSSSDTKSDSSSSSSDSSSSSSSSSSSKCVDQTVE